MEVWADNKRKNKQNLRFHSCNSTSYSKSILQFKQHISPSQDTLFSISMHVTLNKAF